MIGRSPAQRRSLVLIHGAWHGAWAWQRVMPLLRAAGFSATAPDLSGLGEDALQPDGEVGLQAHGADVTAHLIDHNIWNAVVVGHSYGGCVLSQALADDAEGRIAHAIYLDALVPRSGEALADFVDAEARQRFEALREARGLIPVWPEDSWEGLWGITGPDADFCRPRLRPMPPACFLEPVRGDPDAHPARRTYVRCMQNRSALFDRFRARCVADPRFACAELDGHHDIMLIDPTILGEGLRAALST